MWITPAYAQVASGAPGAQGLVQLMLPIALIFVVFYFLLIRPQQKKAGDHKKMIESMRRGDQVITAGGIYGKVTKVADDGRVTIEIAPNVRIDVVRSTVAEVLGKTKPLSAKEAKDKKADSAAEADDAEPAADADVKAKE